jgi:hypothetical protein
MEVISVKLFFDKTNVAAAFDTSEPNFRQVVKVGIQTHILLQVVLGDVVTPHHLKIALTIAHDDIGLAFDQNPEAVGIVCQVREEAVQ